MATPLPLAFELVGELLTPREEHTATLLNNGKVLITGGRNQFGDATEQTELFDPETDSVLPASDMPAKA